MRKSAARCTWRLAPSLRHPRQRLCQEWKRAKVPKRVMQEKEDRKEKKVKEKAVRKVQTVKQEAVAPEVVKVARNAPTAERQVTAPRAARNRPKGQQKEELPPRDSVAARARGQPRQLAPPSRPQSSTALRPCPTRLSTLGLPQWLLP